MMREAFKRAFEAISRLISGVPTLRAIKQGKGKGKSAHKPTGIAKARRAARKIRNKQRSK
jgi:hypothetical protein